MTTLLATTLPALASRFIFICLPAAATASTVIDFDYANTVVVTAAAGDEVHIRPHCLLASILLLDPASLATTAFLRSRSSGE